MSLIRDLESKISHLEEILQNISVKILANIFYEDAPPARLLADSENYISALRETAEEAKSIMLLLKPERTPSIKRAFREFTQPIDAFIRTLREAEATRGSSKPSLEHLKAAIKQGQDFVGLAKEIAKNPSMCIAEILRLKEISEAKDYILRVNVPEAIYIRLEHLKKSLESLKAHILSLDESARDLLRCIDKAREEISKFQKVT